MHCQLLQNRHRNSTFRQSDAALRHDRCNRQCPAYTVFMVPAHAEPIRLPRSPIDSMISRRPLKSSPPTMPPAQAIDGHNGTVDDDRCCRKIRLAAVGNDRFAQAAGYRAGRQQRQHYNGTAIMIPATTADLFAPNNGHVTIQAVELTFSDGARPFANTTTDAVNSFPNIGKNRPSTPFKPGARHRCRRFAPLRTEAQARQKAPPHSQPHRNRNPSFLLATVIQAEATIRRRAAELRNDPALKCAWLRIAARGPEGADSALRSRSAADKCGRLKILITSQPHDDSLSQRARDSHLRLASKLSSTFARTIFRTALSS